MRIGTPARRARFQLMGGGAGGTPRVMRVRSALPSCLLLGLLLASAGRAVAQPVDPYGPAPAPAPKPAPAPAPGPGPGSPAPAQVYTDDPVLAEQIALALVHRAQELYDARVFVDAKQLAVEAVIRSPKGIAAEQARFLIKQINEQLGISDAPQKPAARPPEPEPGLHPTDDP